MRDRPLGPCLTLAVAAAAMLVLAWAGCGSLAAQPLAYLVQFKVVAVDDHDPAFPTAVEQAASARKSLLRPASGER